MKLEQFKDLLQTHREKQFRLVLPNQVAVPISFHITEVAHVRKRFIDCGGKFHTTDTCQLQAWLGEDIDHRLQAGKMADVLGLAKQVLPEGQDLDIEIEYEDTVISQYPVASYTVTDDAVVLNLTSKHTDCLAKESCCPTPEPRPKMDIAMSAPIASGCGCGPSGCCD
jgi:hypothetical protein